eukprot:GFYU01004507.1.p1 GENE.GFYU01004507.1~~GFYU01004507.1.p1  ORF type:complete len:395 (+),score=120.36 GFYU01004507.1:475-1659(+)
MRALLASRIALAVFVGLVCLSAFQTATAEVVSGFYVTAYQSEEVVTQGKVNPEWSKDGSTRTIEVAKPDTTFELSFLGKETGYKTLMWGPATIATADDTKLKVNFSGSSDTNGTLHYTNDESIEEEVLTVAYTCEKQGTIQVTMKIPIKTSGGGNSNNTKDISDELTITWKKTCAGGPRKGLSVNLVSQKTAKAVPAVIGGVALQRFNKTLDTPLFLVGQQRKSTKFEIDLAGGTQKWVKILIQPTFPILETSWELDKDSDPYMFSQKKTKMLITWKCTDHGQTEVNISILLTNNWNPLTWTILKDCGEEPSSGSVHHIGAGVIFAIFFVLIVGGCIAGCAFNYLVLGRRGENVLPFIDTIRYMRDWLHEKFGWGKPQYTRQEDFHEPPSAYAI